MRNNPKIASAIFHKRSYLESILEETSALAEKCFLQATAAAEKEKLHPESRNVANFWRMFVEDELLCSSNERKFLGFQLFNILLPFLG